MAEPSPYQLKTVHDAAMIVETVRHPLLILDNQFRVQEANPSFYHTFRVLREETIGKLIYELGNHQWDIPDLHTLLEEILPQNQAFEDFRVDHKFESIGRRVMMINAKRLDSIQMILLAIEDVTDREKAWANVQFGELNHRVKNTIALVQAIASQTIQHSDSLEAFRESFGGRLRALANVQSMLLSGDSEGVPLKTMLENELAPYGPDIRQRCTITGERDLRLNSEAAQSFQLVLHELVTNANKYGALSQSAEGARLSVNWRLVPARGAGGPNPGKPSPGGEKARIEEAMHFDWVEHPGPKGAGEALSGPPGGPSVEGKSGLGLELIRTVVEYEIGGTITMTLPEAGQVGASCNIVVPWTADGIGYRPREAGAYVTKKQDRPD